MNTLPTCVIAYMFEFLPLEAKGNFRQTCKKYSKLQLPVNQLIRRNAILVKILRMVSDEYELLSNSVDYIVCDNCPKGYFEEHIADELVKCIECDRHVCYRCEDSVFNTQPCFACNRDICEVCDKNPAHSICFMCSKKTCCGEEFYGTFICSKCMN